MKKRIGQVFSLILVLTLVIAIAVPVHADVSDAVGYVVGEFWDMMTGKEYDMYFDYWKNFTGYLEPIPKLTIDMYEFTPNNDSAGKMNEG